MASDERDTSDSVKDFDVNTHNVIMDRVVESFERRFVDHRSLYMDMACLNPSILEEIVIKGLPDGALKSISSFLPTIGIDAAKNELMSFTLNFYKLKMSLVEYSNEAMILIDQIDVLEDDKEDKEGFCGELCRSCPNWRIISSGILQAQ